MTTTRIETPRHGLVPISERAYDGKPFSGGLQLRLAGSNATLKNDRERRPKPEAPLVLSPTARDRNWIEIHDYYAAQEDWVHGPSNQRSIRSVISSDVRAYHPVPSAAMPLGQWITPLRNKIKNLDISMGESVFEYRETAKLFLAAAHGIRGFVKGVNENRKRNRSGARKKKVLDWTLSSVANSHLGASLGVMPLIQTAVDSALLLQDRLNTPDFFVLKKFVQKSKPSSSTRQSIPWGFETPYYTCDRVSTSVIDATQRAVVYVKFRPGKVAGWTMGNPLQVGYELLTLSFVLDWFIPVGAFLSSLDAMSDVESVLGTVSTRYRYTLKVETVPRGVLWMDRYLDGVSGYTVSHKQLRAQRTIGKMWWRDLVTEIPLPPFPRWEPSPAWGKLGTALAIFQQVRSGR